MEGREDIVDRYKKRLEQELGEKVTEDVNPTLLSREYQQFKTFFLPRQLTIYEQMCSSASRILKVRVNEKRSAELNEAIQTLHLEATPSGTQSFAFIAAIIAAILGSLFAFAIFQSLFFVLLVFISGLVMVFPLQKLPDFLASNWRMKASNQMVQCVFYIVTYMRHTSNLERAIKFASDHVDAPLSIDLKKILWDVESGKYDTIKDSLESYLEAWKKYNIEFIEAFHLIEASLYEGSESRRLDTLDKSLSVILTETYEKMLHYAHDLQSPVTMLHMLGVILPILGLVVLPLVVSFMVSDETTPTQIALYIAVLYNVILPVGVYYLGKVVLSKRPTGYGEADISLSRGENQQKYITIMGIELPLIPLVSAFSIFGILFLIGMSPLIIHFLSPSYDISVLENSISFLGYICPTGLECAIADKIGPYGIGASVLSIFVTMSFGVGLGAYFAMRSKNIIDTREKTKKLEDEFAGALFQLGNRLGDGLPAEIAFGRVADIMQGTTSGEFFSVVNKNITKLGMSVEDAIFNSHVGAIVYYPSNVIESAMKVLVESGRKGPKIAAQALISMSRYIKEIHRVDERLKDLLAETLSSMKGQIRFLTPAIAGIVVGITAMVTTILNTLGTHIASLTSQGQEATSGILEITNLFGTGVPPFYFQIIVGLYVVQITYILTILSSSIENGSDPLNERYLLGKYMKSATLLYCFIAVVVTVMFSYIATQILPKTLS